MYVPTYAQTFTFALKPRWHRNRILVLPNKFGRFCSKIGWIGWIRWIPDTFVSDSGNSLNRAARFLDKNKAYLVYLAYFCPWYRPNKQNLRSKYVKMHEKHFKRTISVYNHIFAMLNCSETSLAVYTFKICSIAHWRIQRGATGPCPPLKTSKIWPIFFKNTMFLRFFQGCPPPKPAGWIRLWEGGGQRDV